MLIRLATGILCAATALVAGYWGARAMFTFSSSGVFFWLPMVSFGAPILLLVGAVFTLFPKVRKGWLLVLAGIIVVTFWAAFLRDFSKPYLIFAAAVMLTTWAVLGFASALKRPAIVAFGASVSLALFWLPVPLGVFRSTISLGSPVASALAANSPLLALWSLIIATSVLSGFASFRTERA